MHNYTTVSTNPNHAVVKEPIVLHETTTTRRIFIAEINDNPKKVGLQQTVSGTIVHQRKGRNDDWEDIESINLNTLKAGGGVKLYLKSEQTRLFYDALTELYKLSSTGVQTETITFEEFEKQATAILEEHKKLLEQKSDTTPVLFRGHDDASYKLKTSLERYSDKRYSPKEYWNVMRAIRPTLETCTGKTWDFSTKYNRTDKVPQAPQASQEYEFMVYLRHHGFPSPLLDWTRSFYIAAFFAFQSAQVNKEPNVSIYSFDEYPRGHKGGSSNEATIVGHGSTITTHKRHFSQQAQYTLCYKPVEGEYFYCSHEEAFARKNDEQDILNKFIIPKTERPKVLEKLNMMNINAYSLFGSEERLLETLAYKEIK